MLKRIFLSLIITLTVCCYPVFSQYQFPGGSNYGWYNLNGCDRDPYGVIYNYDVAGATIDSQLQAMYANGQRRLRIPIFHRRGDFGSGTVLDSTGANLSSRFRSNLTNFLNSVRQHGFVEIEVSFHPIGGNDPAYWTAFSEDLYQENWNFIVNLRLIIAGAGLAYKIDLLNEGIPASNQPVLLQYTRRLWGDYTFVYGKGDTVGFSVANDNDRIQQIPSVYQGNYPNVFDMHFYFNAYSVFINTHNTLVGFGLTQSWIVGEAFYDDAQEARELKQAIQETGRTVFFLTQWPSTRALSCDQVNIAPPLTNTAYYNNVLNPIDDAQFFVRQQYLDLLNREPDPGGFAFWLGRITQCGSDVNCLNQQRVGTSHAFFDSDESRQNNPAFANPGTTTYNQAFVRQCYLSYLRREPEQSGYDHWLSMLESQRVNRPGNIPQDYDDIIEGFIISAEYRQRFGPA